MLSEIDLKTVLETPRGRLDAPPSAWLRVTGPDATEFLQGQCTQDLRALASGGAAWGLWLTIKGRVAAETLVLRDGAAVGRPETWWLWSPHGAGETLRARLEDFIIADDVTVEDVGAGGGWSQTTLAGPVAEQWLAEAAPGEGEWRSWRGGLVFRGRRGQPLTWEWLRPAEAPWPADAPQLEVLRPEELVRARIAAGVPAIPGEFGAADLPQEAGLEDVAVSFKKGCYLGQEVMARLHAMGRVRRRLLRVAGAGPAPDANTTLHHAADDKRAGELRAAVDDGRGGWLGLAMVNLLGLDPTKALKLGDNTLVGAGWSVILLDVPTT